MNPKRALAALFASPLLSLLTGLVLIAPPAEAQDRVTVGTVTASGNTVDVPVYIRDASGTSLGRDQPPGSRIQSISIKVNYAPAAAVQSVSFTKAGITAALHPGFEASPSGTGTISWLAGFSESTDLIPFTLDAPSPGDQVAHLFFTLSSSATPGSSISLSIDSSLTQLNDQAGSSGTAENSSNGRLTLVDGAINIPQLSLAIIPGSRSIFVNDSTVFTVEASSNVSSSTTIALSSTNPGIASMPSSAVIPAGARSVDVGVIGAAVGEATITATLPPASGGASASAFLTVSEAPIPCLVPLVPQINAPAAAEAGKSYTVSWSAVTGATDYVLEESTDPSFSPLASSANVATTSASFTHAAANRYYYRVRARNQITGCNTTSLFSNTVSVLVSIAPVAQTRVLPVVGSVPGSLGSYFKTSVQLYNAKSSAVSGKIVFHTQNASGSSTDPSIAYTIQPGKSLSYPDLLPAMGIASGLGSADVVADAGSAFPVTLARVFNDGGAAGTTGLALEPMAVSDALQNGETAALIAPADTKFRLNIGVRTLAQGASITFTVRDKDGVVVKTTSRSYGPTFFQQVGSSVILDGYVLTGGETIAIQVTAGSAFIYGSTTDNTTQDPSVQFARKVE